MKAVKLLTRHRNGGVFFIKQGRCGDKSEEI